MSNDLLKLIHSIVVTDNMMPSMKQTALHWADYLKDYIRPDCHDKLVSLIDALPEDKHMLHGDYHICNVMYQNGEALLIDMDTLCHGHPIFELASMYNVYKGYCAVDHGVAESFLGLPYDTISTFWDRSLALYLGTEDPVRLKSVEEKCEIIGYTRVMRRTIRRRLDAEAKGKALVEHCKNRLEELLPRVDTLLF